MNQKFYISKIYSPYQQDQKEMSIVEIHPVVKKRQSFRSSSAPRTTPQSNVRVNVRAGPKYFRKCSSSNKMNWNSSFKNNSLYFWATLKYSISYKSSWRGVSNGNFFANVGWNYYLVIFKRFIRFQRHHFFSQIIA